MLYQQLNMNQVKTILRVSTPFEFHEKFRTQLSAFWDLKFFLADFNFSLKMKRFELI